MLLVLVAGLIAVVAACTVPPTGPGTDPTFPSTSTTASTTTSTTSTTSTTLPTLTAPTVLRLNSTGDYIGQGTLRTLSPPTHTFAVSGGGSRITVIVGGSSGWRLEFAAPIGRRLEPGPFELATRHPFQSPTRPGLSVTGESRGCNRSTGRFDIRDATTDANGNLVRFAADFTQICDGRGSLSGTVRWNAVDPYPAPADTDADGVPDTVDNCVSTSNPGQHDGVGDACDGVVTHTRTRRARRLRVRPRLQHPDGRVHDPRGRGCSERCRPAVLRRLRAALRGWSGGTARQRPVERHGTLSRRCSRSSPPTGRRN